MTCVRADGLPPTATSQEPGLDAERSRKLFNVVPVILVDDGRLLCEGRLLIVLGLLNSLALKSHVLHSLVFKSQFLLASVDTALAANRIGDRPKSFDGAARIFDLAQKLLGLVEFQTRLH
eukprot:CAMPEP_0170432060 /NCGR_PEP_ID=MMETSP0117_2-20130122/41745_1 /TAXON_ID=400756 /ORGANISM="Durinskia baltica, Strain CSIRO CS-38" /LENGTH=119 /DNA_ID=CAMNT_0010691681 /DNA_START=39 /DNA_END=396 /DNA_ORIENTATION=-